MNSKPPSPAVPGDVQPPTLEVGYNYTWAFNRYGTTIGPRDLHHDPPTGAGDAIPVWLESRPTAHKGTLDRNLKVLRDDLNIRKVRLFLMGNAFNYGNRPIANATSGGGSFFNAPAGLHPLFVSHFTKMLEVFRDNEMQILPSLIDFGAFYPLGQAGGGRTSILTSQRSRFLSTVLQPMVKASLPFKSSIFAWEVVNEPKWNTFEAPPFFHRPHTASSSRDCEPDVMASFLRDCLAVIGGNGFESTVGHRFVSDLAGPMPTGSLPQFHYYAGTGLPRRTAGVADPDPIPVFGDATVGQAFVGEFGTAPGGQKNQFGDEEPGAPWPECGGADTTRRAATFERLKVLARKGYRLAFVWPDRGDKEPGIANDDELKLSADVRESIKQFTRGRFKGGVP